MNPVGSRFQALSNASCRAHESFFFGSHRHAVINVQYRCIRFRRDQHGQNVGSDSGTACDWSEVANGGDERGFNSDSISELRSSLEEEQLAVADFPMPTTGPSTGDVEDALFRLTRDHPGVPYAIVAVGHGASAVWDALPDLADELDSAVFVGVPAVMNLDVANLTRTPILDLHAASDAETVEAHESVHAALAIARVPHEMVVFDQVGAAFYDPDSNDWSDAYWSETRQRITDWLNKALFTDDLLEVQ